MNQNKKRTANEKSMVFNENLKVLTMHGAQQPF